MSFDAIAEALDNADAENQREVFYEERGKLIRKFRFFAGLTSKALADEIDASASWVKQAETQGKPLPKKYAVPLFNAIGIPYSAMKGPNSFHKFMRKHPYWFRIIDAVLDNNPHGDEEGNLFPTQFIIKMIDESDFDNLSDWSDYIDKPDNTDHPDERKITNLEEALGLSVGALQDLQKVRSARSATIRALIDLRSTFVANVEMQLQSRQMNWTDLAERAKLSKEEVYRIRDCRTLNFRYAVDIATALDEPLVKLLMTNGEFIEYIHSDEGFKNVPLVARKLMSDYIAIIRERSDKGPSSSAQALLIITPLLGAMLREFSRQVGSKFTDSTNVFTLLNAMANSYSSEAKNEAK